MSTKTCKQILKSCMPETEIILKKKRIPNEKFWIIYKLLHILFLGDCYSQVFICQSTMVADIFTQYPSLLPTTTIKKLPTALRW